MLLVLSKPTEELEEVLGIDIPPVPEVTLSRIASDSVLLFWKSPENYYTPLSLDVQVNGISGTVCPFESVPAPADSHKRLSLEPMLLSRSPVCSLGIATAYEW